jgi:hypothetical protein
VAQDFWASSGFRDLRSTPEGLAPTPQWLRGLLTRAELLPPDEAGPRERALHARLMQDPEAAIGPRDLAALEDPDARENWAAFADFRARVAAAGTLEACYRGLFGHGAVPVSPVFVDVLARAIMRAALDGTEDAYLCRAAEIFFRPQRISTEDGRVLAADAQTIEVFAETGGFGNVGRLLRQQNTAVPAVKMDVLDAENAPLYFMRDELFGFVLDLTPGTHGARGMAEALACWIGRVAGARVTIEPLARIQDPRWRWHVGLDAEATAILDALYRGDAVDAGRQSRLLLLFRLDFLDEREVIAQMHGKPVWLGLACRADRTLRMKPQNLLTNLPLAGTPAAGG